jgi:ubiquitin carboxyl-terminal hydrolase 5/13
MSMAEMELEMNKKVGSEYAAIVESGQELEPLFGAFHTGIKNLGNTCYIGSVLQALFSLPYFREKFQQPAEYDANCHENFWKQFQRVGHALCSGDYAQPIVAKGKTSGLSATCLQESRQSR